MNYITYNKNLFPVSSKTKVKKQEPSSKKSKLFKITQNDGRKVSLETFKKGWVKMYVYGCSDKEDLIVFNQMNTTHCVSLFFKDYHILNFYENVKVRIEIDDEYEEQNIEINNNGLTKRYTRDELKKIRECAYFIYGEIFCDRFYDTPKVWDNLETCVDIGSNAGFFTLKALEMGAKKVVCVEPDERLWEINKILNKGSDTKYMKKAFYSKKGEKVNFLLADLRQSGGQTIFPEYSPEAFKGEVISETTDLEEVTESFEEIDVLKCDCEGAEKYLFSEKNLKILRNKVKYITIEMHIKNDDDISYYEQCLKNEGFAAFSLHKGGVKSKIYHLYGINENFKKLKKIAYLTPHFSTGGMPQYLVNKIEEDIEKGLDVYVIEHTYGGDPHTIQRKKAQKILKSNFKSAGGNKGNILKFIKEINPDILHLQEEPALFNGLNEDFWRQIFSKDRSYFLKITSHTSAYIPTDIFLPDEYVFCCKTHFETYKDTPVTKTLSENKIIRKEKNENAYDILKIDKNKKHVLQVGIFNDNKNQKYLINIAKNFLDKDVVFHFVGGMARNYENYWGKLDKPTNCIFWGERNDVDLFYSIADLFVLSSRQELNPISLKEALSYGVKCLVSDLSNIRDNTPEEHELNFLKGEVFQDSVEIGNFLDITPDNNCQSLTFDYSDEEKDKIEHIKTKNLSFNFSSRKEDQDKDDAELYISVFYRKNNCDLRIVIDNCEIFKGKIDKNITIKTGAKKHYISTLEIFDNEEVTKVDYDIIHQCSFVSLTGEAENFLVRSENGKKINYKDKTLITMGSSALGDNLAWIPYVEEYRKLNKHTTVYCYSKFKDLFDKVYENIHFVNNVDAKYNKKFFIGISLGENDSAENNYSQIPLQQIASNTLGLDYEEIRPNIFIKNKTKKSKKKYVCIATQSTAKAKLWQKKYWEEIISFLNSKGYEVLCIDKHQSFGIKGDMNHIPNGCVNKTGDIDLQDRITDIYNCEFFIGLASGLSWLAWALQKPVIMISGFSDPKSEFYTPYRVHSKDGCNSCWNDTNCSFDRNDWLWCPRNKDFECSKNITPAMVKQPIISLLGG